MAAIMYAGQDVRNNGKFPRTYFDPGTADRPALYTGTESRRSIAADPTDPAVPRPNDVTAAFYLLLKTSDLTSDVFNCPQDTAATRFEGEIAAKSNWPGGPRHLSYSYNNPYPNRPALKAGWKFDTTLSPDYPLAADMNYGDNPKGGPTRVSYDAPQERMASANSANHWFQGQHVAYVDAHVEWRTSPFCGVPRVGVPFRDNIYAGNAGANPTTGVGGATHAAPADPQDAVLLPTAFDVPTGAAAAAVARVPGMLPPPDRESRNTPAVGGAIAALLAVVVMGMAVLILLLRRNPAAAPPGASPPADEPNEPG